MNLDDLMAVWKSQDAAPLHGVNETLLGLALRQDAGKLQAKRRREKWFVYLITAFLVADMARYLFRMLSPSDGRVLTAWDYLIPVVGGAATLLWAGMVHARHRAQSVREQGFGDSLRDQINRQLAQLAYWPTRVRVARVFGGMVLPIVTAMAMIVASWRLNNRLWSNSWLWVPIVFMIFWSALCLKFALWQVRRRAERDILPRKQKLEELLRELDGQ